MSGRVRNTDKPVRSELGRKLQSLANEHGPWTAHDITLAPGIHTLGANVADSRLRRVVQVVADTVGKPLNELRILDLGCLEAQFAIEFALHGASVVAVEGREANLRKSEFAIDALAVGKRIELRQGDVRDVDPKGFGTFDAVLCLGILYHLDAPDVMQLVASMSKVCTGVVVIDTHISLASRTQVEWQGHHYWGDFWTEYAAGARAKEEDGALWSSIGNDRSFLLTKASLCNLLRHTGFTSVFECLNPYEHHSPDWPNAPRDGEWLEWPDRTTFVAVKGDRQHILSSAATEAEPEHDRPERPRYLQPVRPAAASPIGEGRRLLGAVARRLLRGK